MEEEEESASEEVGARAAVVVGIGRAMHSGKESGYAQVLFATVMLRVWEKEAPAPPTPLVLLAPSSLTPLALPTVTAVRPRVWQEEEALLEAEVVEVTGFVIPWARGSGSKRVLLVPRDQTPCQTSIPCPHPNTRWCPSHQIAPRNRQERRKGGARQCLIW